MEIIEADAILKALKDRTRKARQDAEFQVAVVADLQHDIEIMSRQLKAAQAIKEALQKDENILTKKINKLLKAEDRFRKNLSQEKFKVAQDKRANKEAKARLQKINPKYEIKPSKLPEHFKL